MTPYIWLEKDAEAAARFYVSLFPRSKIVDTNKFGVTFELDGQRVFALNGGPNYKLTPAFSLMYTCETQDEIDRLWARLGDGGQELRCGWITDRFGLTWQIIPRTLTEMLTDKDPACASRVTEAMMAMIKIDIAGLQRAYDRRS
jgi:predicted 3-demethylubiquinone-9 3-methyltransferase (glyoxalase superfamily)